MLWEIARGISNIASEFLYDRSSLVTVVDFNDGRTVKLSPSPNISTHDVLNGIKIKS